MNASVALALAAAAGGAIALQAAINSRLRQVIDQPLWATYASILGTFFFGSMMMLTLRPPLPNAELLRATSWWHWCGGLLGVVIVMSGAVLVPYLGAAKFIAAVVAGQMAASLVLDHFALMGLAEAKLDLVKVIGAVLIVLGVICIKYR